MQKNFCSELTRLRERLPIKKNGGLGEYSTPPFLSISNRIIVLKNNSKKKNRTYHSSGPWYMVEPLSSVTMNTGSMMTLHALVFLLGCVLVGLFTMLLSLLLNHAVASIGMVFAVVIADLFLSVPTKLRTLSQIRYLTPISALMNTRVQDMRLIKMFGKHLISLQAAPLFYVFCCIALILVSVLVFYRRCEKR